MRTANKPQELVDRTQPKVVELTLLRRPPEQVEWLEHVAQEWGKMATWGCGALLFWGPRVIIKSTCFILVNMIL